MSDSNDFMNALYTFYQKRMYIDGEDYIDEKISWLINAKKYDEIDTVLYNIDIVRAGKKLSAYLYENSNRCHANLCMRGSFLARIQEEFGKI